MATKTAKKLRTFRELCKGKPSRALAFMVRGLERQSRRRVFQINMGSFGSVRSDQKVCFGCAATCAVQEACGVNLVPRDFISKPTDLVPAWAEATKLGVNWLDLRDFEYAMDGARCGELERLADYFGIRIPDYLVTRNISLETDNWRDQLPAVWKWITELKAAGL